MESKSLIITNITTTTTNTTDTTIVNNETISLTYMFNLPLQLPVSGPAIDPKTVITHVNGIITHGTGLSDKVQKITSVPAVGNQQIITLLNTLVQGRLACETTFKI
ncbi:hypothetical protein E6O75_ATG11489 [Venturia nashicola]|uniref:Uncharacterized protein n=1 Tax=Venturia nashicola TaxID=86259 RepID=A0A4Z1NPY4_9PEZI|nr:hypothetical protein E6O75_ATG11489 [Venturia nashicola]